ncbi:lysine 2,3-aminomutase [Legionella birminghamensis]|uniref:L-lysine 2,3-aminomutase n=2 Tax=Legionella birminghamensis TaxID=28083 RepID=A0A378ICU2_9GAMM|nr:lysine 2,3-aminomutase [Legionella birminghamensis]STX33047.1 lysine 2,3-aminomutase [Legionella birminghamensis]
MRDAFVSWQKILAQGFASSTELLQFLGLATQDSSAAERLFKTRVPRGFAARMQKNNPDDPLLLQVLATEKELFDAEGYQQDPLQENNSNPLNGLLHKYNGRVLLTLTGTCAVHCRYCFRRHFPYQKNNPGREGWQRVIEYIRTHPDVSEVILSGGDPLLASNRVLKEVLGEVDQIDHVTTIRFHTRVPIVLPERIDEEFSSILSALRKHKVVVLHCNHAQEINEDVETACRQLRASGCHLLNQAVLLKAVNAEASTLAELSKRLFSCGILPYYLHVLDKVAGAAHFDLPDEKASAIFRELQTLLPGYLVPRLAREEAGKSSKTLLY